MVSMTQLLTQAAFLLCIVLFARLFTYRRGSAKFRRSVSCLAAVVMGCSGATVIYILTGDLHIPVHAWPLVVLLGVFVWSIWQSRGNLAGAFRAERWDGMDRRQVDRRKVGPSADVAPRRSR